MPSYHLCPNFRISPAPNGHLQLGSILKNFEEDGVQFPLNHGKVVPVPNDKLSPRDGYHAERGFTFNMSELRSVDAGIWSKIFGLAELSAKFSRSRGTGEVLTVQELRTQTFLADEEYTNKCLEIPPVKAYVNARRRGVPVYMVTGIMIATGASWSSTKRKGKEAGAGAGMGELHPGVSVGGGGMYVMEGERTIEVVDSDDFVLGIRLRKIWWDKSGPQTSDRVVGSVLGNQSLRASVGSLATGLRIADDFQLDDAEASSSDRIFVDKSLGTGLEPVTWILP